ncbi:hypothetical protein C7Y71_003740 [Pseudoprevotella muciniphila]|uniref:DUF1566 domain-containing protein n=1 Tax=Pseudoprevotella muciniphila TaxID=2133944 RepID=A0A5P8E5K5_9BACT|nr:hypothetical protein [Pseudoprevotella muciniphila]QFQ12204.1 hypothetical protein C7Y71_003740 [Pseudoprevotella muciniphila]
MKRFVIILMALAVGLPISAQQTCPDSNHPHAIDLGLPSGTKWACCNVGASRPTAYGDYYAWGEIATKTNYDWSTYKWGEIIELTKYCDNPDFGENWHTDNKTVLDPEDDVAHVKWGGQWRMPTKEQMEELCNNTKEKWIENYKGTGVNGSLLTATNGKSIFLPAGGERDDTQLYCAYAGFFWSSSLVSGCPGSAYGLSIGSGEVFVDDFNSRTTGRTVRPVRP